MGLELVIAAAHLQLNLGPRQHLRDCEQERPRIVGFFTVQGKDDVAGANSGLPAGAAPLDLSDLHTAAGHASIAP